MPDDVPDPARYGEAWASIYDSCYTFDHNAEAAVDALARLVGSGSALELAIGTGRVALPLAQRGVQVHGLDASPAMIELLKSKPGGESIPVTLGNLRDVPVDGRFDLVFVVCNSIFALLTQEEQLACFRNVAARLAPGGHFVVECFVPTPTRLLSGGDAVRPWKLTDTSALFHLLQHDPVRQVIDGQTVEVTSVHGLRMFPSHVRYIWPSEMDLMARLAGMTLVRRRAGWNDEPFTADATTHVSVYTLDNMDA